MDRVADLYIVRADRFAFTRNSVMHSKTEEG